MSDPTLLALVIDDPLAPKVLAAWKALRLDLAACSLETTHSRIALLVQGDLTETRRTLDRCQLAGLLVDGGIAPLADQWLSAHIGTRLGRPRPASKPPNDAAKPKAGK